MKPGVSSQNLRNALLGLAILAVIAVAVWLNAGGHP